MSRVRVDVEEVLKLRARMDEINSPALKNVDFYYHGIPMKVSEEDIKEWRFTGLSNVLFVEIILNEQLAKGHFDNKLDKRVILDEQGYPAAIQG